MLKAVEEFFSLLFRRVKRVLFFYFWGNCLSLFQVMFSKGKRKAFKGWYATRQGCCFALCTLKYFPLWLVTQWVKTAKKCLIFWKKKWFWLKLNYLVITSDKTVFLAWTFKNETFWRIFKHCVCCLLLVAATASDIYEIKIPLLFITCCV